MSENYNIFKVLKFERKETIHSAMIAAIIEHDKHNWDAFFKLLEKKGKETVFFPFFQSFFFFWYLFDV